MSPSGQYVAASGRDGQIFVWDLNTRKCVARYVASIVDIGVTTAFYVKHNACLKFKPLNEVI